MNTKQRQSLRKAILFISFLLFPVTLYYFSPYLIIQGAIEGIMAGSFIMFMAMFFSALIFGRAFCGWLCPAGGLQESLMLVAQKPATGGRFDLIKFALWVPWITGIGFAAMKAGGFKTVDFFYQTTSGISVANPFAYIVYYGVLFLIVTLSLLAGRRGFCHYSCWMAPFLILGTSLRNLLKMPGLRLKSQKNQCIHCGQCSKKCPMSLPVEQMASSGNMIHLECILCGECADTCPKKVIRFGFNASSNQ